MKISLFKKYFEANFKVPNKKINKKNKLPTSNTYKLFKENNYNIVQLKEICNKYNIKTRPIWRLLFKLPMYIDCQKDSQKNALQLENTIINIPSNVKIG